MSVSDRGRDKAKRWQVRWRDDQGVQRKKSFAKKTLADQWDAKVKADLTTGSYVDPTSKITVAEAALAWLELRPHRESTRRRMRALVDNHIVAVPLGSRRLAQVRPSEVQAWAIDRTCVLGPGVMRQLVSTLRSVYAGAVLDRLVGSNPVGKLALPRGERERVVPLTVEQVQRLAAAMPPRNRAMVITQAGLGLRIGELLGLRVSDVNFLARTVRIESQIDDSGKRTELKTPGSRRTLPLPQVVADALAAHLVEYPPITHTPRQSGLPRTAGRSVNESQASTRGLIFCQANGNPYRRSSYGHRIFRVAAQQAGLPPGTSTHDLRHHYASVLLQAGESVAVVAERLGHADAAMIVRTYGHVMPGSEQRTRKAIDGAWVSKTATEVNRV